MLVFTRKIQEKFIIGDDISVTILGIKGNQIRLGIDAPKEISVHREEIYNKINNEIKNPMSQDDFFTLPKIQLIKG